MMKVFKAEITISINLRAKNIENAIKRTWAIAGTIEVPPLTPPALKSIEVKENPE